MPAEPAMAVETGPELEFDLANNELPHGPLPGVRESVEAEIDRLARYPDPMSEELCSAIASAIGVPVASVFAGHGSSGALTAVLRFASGPDATVVFAVPGFTGYDALVRAAGARPLTVPGGAGAWQPLGAMSAAVQPDTTAVIVTSPHNPSGEVVRPHDLAALLRIVAPSTLVVLDEAYADFDEGHEGAEILSMVEAHANLVVVRSFSKAHGLAALRVGYAVGNARFIQRLRPSLIPYEVGTMASAAAIASLRHPDELAVRVAEVRRAREELAALGRRHGFPVPTSFGNFVWLPTTSTEPLTASFAAHRIAVREYPGSGIRITATTPRAVTAVAEVFDRFARETRRQG